MEFCEEEIAYEKCIEGLFPTCSLFLAITRGGYVGVNVDSQGLQLVLECWD